MMCDYCDRDRVPEYSAIHVCTDCFLNMRDYNVTDMMTEEEKK